MKKILLVNASPRKGGNSDIAIQTLAENLSDQVVTIFTMRDKNCHPCQACAACQGKTTQTCVQKDDITALLPLIDQCDAIILASPIYNHQINSQAKLFIERFYPFFNVTMKNMSNTSKQGKKAALICICWGSPRDVTERYATWTVVGFSQIGATETQSLVFNEIPERGAIRQRDDYLAQLKDLAGWLAE